MDFPAYPLADYLAHRVAIDEAMRRVAASRAHILGPEVEAFEREFGTFLGGAHVVGVGNGTDAIELALRGCGVSQGQLVAVPSHTAVASVAAIERAGAVPVFVDVAMDTMTLDPAALDIAWQATGGTIKAVVVVHLYGCAADMGRLCAWCRERGVILIEDAAQAHGARWEGQPLGTIGDAGAFSFYPTKNLGAIGDAGAVVSRAAGLPHRIRELRQYGWRDRYVSAVPGVNSRLDELQAAILRCKLGGLDAANARRRSLAALYAEGLADLPITLPFAPPGTEHAFHLFVVRTERRDALESFLRERSIPVARHYPLGVHRQPAYEGRIATFPEGLPATEQIVSRILSLPLHPHLEVAHVRAVVAAIREFFCRREK